MIMKCSGYLTICLLILISNIEAEKIAAVDNSALSAGLQNKSASVKPKKIKENKQSNDVTFDILDAMPTHEDNANVDRPKNFHYNPLAVPSKTVSEPQKTQGKTEAKAQKIAAIGQNALSVGAQNKSKPFIPNQIKETTQKKGGQQLFDQPEPMVFGNVNKANNFHYYPIAIQGKTVAKTQNIGAQNKSPPVVPKQIKETAQWNDGQQLFDMLEAMPEHEDFVVNRYANLDKPNNQKYVHYTPTAAATKTKAKTQKIQEKTEAKAQKITPVDKDALSAPAQNKSSPIIPKQIKETAQFNDGQELFDKLDAIPVHEDIVVNRYANLDKPNNQKYVHFTPTAAASKPLHSKNQKITQSPEQKHIDQKSLIAKVSDFLVYNQGQALFIALGFFVILLLIFWIKSLFFVKKEEFVRFSSQVDLQEQSQIKI